jgi:hypothetical protein
MGHRHSECRQTRHGVIAAKLKGPANTGGTFAVTVRVTFKRSGVLVAPGDVMTMFAIYTFGGRPDGSMETVTDVDVSERVIQGAMVTAVQVRLPPLALEIVTAPGAGSAPLSV